MMNEKAFQRFVSITLLITLIVILWGAFVRLSGSGDGCGASWPLCQGVLLPQSPSLEMAIEFLHRLTSGLAFIFVLLIFLWSRRLYEKGQLARKLAAASLFFMTTESLIGAALVLFEWVDQSTQPARVVVLALHQVNTLLLLSCILLTRLFAGSNQHFKIEQFKNYQSTLGLAYGLVCTTAVFGVVAAVSSMLYPVDSLIEGVKSDFESGSPLVVRLRALHPLLGVGSTVFVFWLVTMRLPQRREKLGLEAVLLLTVVLQLLLGFITWIAQSSVPLKLAHLLLADICILLITALAVKLGSQHASESN